MDTSKETQAILETRLMIVGGRGMLVNPAAFNEQGLVVRPDLMPPYLARPNRRARRHPRMEFKQHIPKRNR